jgi:FMN-dependent NADH-azoreductase
MGKVLYIKANAKTEGLSRTFRISESFIDEYKRLNPEDEIITLDLYKEGIKLLTAEDINAVFGPKNEDSRNHPILKYAYQFSEADKYVIAEPMWNLGIPAILKAYIDYICVSGITFKYTAEGSEGLCKGKKAVNITARGGEYSSEEGASVEMGDRYLRTILAFMGITDVTTISADGLDIIENDAGKIVNDTINKAKEFARTF